MTKICVQQKNEVVEDEPDPETDRVVTLPKVAPKRRRHGGALFGASALLLLVGGLALGGWRHYQAELGVAATAQQSRTFVPDVRVAVVPASDSNLVKQGWLTLQQGDNDRLTLQAQQAAVVVAESNIAAQQAQIRILEQEKAYQRVVAPFDGVITQRNIDNGSLVTSGSTFMFTLMHPDVIRTQVFVPQDEAFGLGPGVDPVVRVPEIPDRTFPGKITRIATALQPGSRTLLTEIDVPNPHPALHPGIYCTVELLIPRKTPSVIVPADAVVVDQNGLHVAVVENGTVHLQKITIARDFGTEVEVHDGVKPGDQVILNPMVNLAEGNKVAAREAQLASSAPKGY